MHESSAPPQSNKLRIAAIPVLAMVLLWVLLGSNEKTDTDAQADAADVQSSVASKAPSATPKPGKLAVTFRRWPSFHVEETLLHNPFTFSGVSGHPEVQAAPASQADEKSTPPQPSVVPVSVYLASTDGAVALVDGRILREGDRLGDGRRVTRLTPEFVVIEAAP